MDVRILSHRPDTGWSAPLPAGLDSPRTLVLAFAATDYAERGEIWEELARAFASSHRLGCSSAGEILGETVTEGSLVLAVVRFERANLASVAAPIQAVEVSKSTGGKIARALAPHAPRLVLVLSDGLHVNGTDLVHGLGEGLPAGTAIVGGLAGDGDRFGRTWTLVDGLPRSGWVSAVALGGPVAIGHASEGGWQPFGPERVVTRSEGNVLQALDGKPALALYKDYLGDLAAGLPATALYYPLSIRMPGDAGPGIVRTVLGVDEATQSMTFAGDIPLGARTRLMRSSHDRLVEGAAQAGKDARAGMPDADPLLAITVSCVGRRMVLGQRVEEETAATLEALPAGSAQVGFYSYGEISPSGVATCNLHNQTMTLTTIREVAA
jgi:hypothetical protein